jgi:pimeloyl-[acyl-carrier protein] methyl ester esterase
MVKIEHHVHHYNFGMGKTIVLVHGWAMHSGIWLDFAQQLAQRHQVICLDLPAHGQSGNIDVFDLAHISNALVNAVTKQNCCWLGWSLGATVVLDIAQRFPERVNSLVLLAGNPHFTQTPDWAGMDVATFNAFVEAVQIDSNSALQRFLALQVNNNSPDARLLLKQLKNVQTTLPDLASLQAGLAILANADLRTVLSKLNMPIAAIFGSLDNLVPVAVVEQLQQLNPNLQTTIIDDAGHVPFLSHSTDMLRIIENFLAQQ